jgi:quinol monooxygenase YgiN
VETARTLDTGTLQYDIYFNDDESECIVIERYRDSDALIEHGTHVGALMAQIFATGSGTSDMLGEPSPELRAQMADGPV